MENMPAQQQRSQKSNNTALWLIGGIGCGIIVIGAVVLLFRVTQAKISLPFQIGNNPIQNTSLIQTNKNRPADAIIGVGNEFIYKQDIEYELKYAPVNDVAQRKLLEKKLVQDSILLQGAEADKLITLDSSVYNSPNKDYAKRLKLIRTVEKLVVGNSNRINGTVITIWYYNNDLAGPLGYEKGKAFALQKINSLHSAVKSGKISIDEALEQVKQDTSLTQITHEQNANAGIVFDTASQEGPTLDAKLNAALWSLPEGSISDVVSIVDNNAMSHKPTEVAYAFGQVKRKFNSNNNIKDYDSWLKDKKNNYGVTYY